MSVKVWSGGAAAIAQVDKVTPATATDADITSIKIEDHEGLTHTFTYTTTATDTVATICDGLVAAALVAKTGSADGWKDVTVADVTTHITITADTAGDPFTITSSVSGTGTATRAAVTANAGPNIFGAAENWVGDALPVTATDSVLIPAWATDDIYGADFTSVELFGFTIEAGCDINIGHINKPLQIDLEKTAASTTSYPLVSYGTGDIFLDVDNFLLADIRDAGTGSPENGEYAFNLSGTLTPTSAGKVYVRCGAGKSVSLAANPNEVLEAESIDVWSGTVAIGSGVIDKGTSTLPVLVVEEGKVTLESPCLVVTAKVGTLTLKGATAITTLNVLGGTVYRSNSGIITNVNVYGGGIYDATENTTTATDSNVNTWADSTYLDPHEQITRTNSVILNKCGLPGGAGATMAKLDLGTDITIAKT